MEVMFSGILYLKSRKIFILSPNTWVSASSTCEDQRGHVLSERTVRIAVMMSEVKMLYWAQNCWPSFSIWEVQSSIISCVLRLSRDVAISTEFQRHFGKSAASVCTKTTQVLHSKWALADRNFTQIWHIFWWSVKTCLRSPLTFWTMMLVQVLLIIFPLSVLHLRFLGRLTSVLLSNFL